MFENLNWEQILSAMKNSSNINEDENLESKKNDNALDPVVEEIREIVDDILNPISDN